jgi:TetR/AcrR family transcriptional repressor of lmrAB and yxaGH operons
LNAVPAAKIDSDRLLDRLIDVFRLYGYEGASLTRITEATGLQRASLYHRFPAGKEEMVLAVLDHADRWFQTHVLAPLAESGDPARRVRKMADRLNEFYAGARLSCLLDTLSLGDDSEDVHKQIKDSFTAWLNAMVRVARDARLPPATARRRAEEALMRIQGSLVLARATGDTRPFKRVLRSLPGFLTAK